jgi:hypothetical protein
LLSQKCNISMYSCNIMMRASFSLTGFAHVRNLFSYVFEIFFVTYVFIRK